MTYIKFYIFFQRFFRIFQLTKKEDNVTSVVYRILRIKRINLTYTSIIEYLKTHPGYPSLKSICDFFDDKNILNYALRIDETDLYKFNTPFIVHVKESGGRILLVYSVNKEHLIYADSFRGKKIISTTQFLKKWDGVVIIIEPTEFSGEADYSEKRKNEIINCSLLPYAIFVFISAALYGIFINKSFSMFLLKISLLPLIYTHLAGLTFSLLLLRQELNLKTKFTDKLCRITTNTDCNAVTKSKASKIFGSITWSDVGVAYFTGGLITLFMFPAIYSINNLALFSIAALPYPVFSILYQWIRIRKWCPLCLSVQLIIIIEFLILIQELKLKELSIITIIPILLIFSTSSLLVLILKYLFISEKEKENIILESLRVKRDPDVFFSKFKKEERIDIPTDKSAIVFGDNQTEILISVFLSFHCSACARKFNTIQKLITNNSKINVQLIFLPANDEMSIRLFSTIYSLFKLNKNIKILEVLQKWYKSNLKERSKLLKDTNVPDFQYGFDNMITYNSTLFRLGEIVKVPSTYVNGYPLPDIYSLEDLSYLINELGQLKNELNEIDV